MKLKDIQGGGMLYMTTVESEDEERIERKYWYGPEWYGYRRELKSVTITIRGTAPELERLLSVATATVSRGGDVALLGQLLNKQSAGSEPRRRCRIRGAMSTSEVPMPLPSRANLEKHWRQRQKLVKAQREAMQAATLRLERPELPVNVTLTRVSARLLDSEDNLPTCLKAPKDAIAAWLGFADDRDDRARWFYDQQKPPDGKPGYQAVRMTIVSGHDNCECCGAPLVAGQYIGPYGATAEGESKCNG